MYNGTQVDREVINHWKSMLVEEIGTVLPSPRKQKPSVNELFSSSCQTKSKSSSRMVRR